MLTLTVFLTSLSIGYYLAGRSAGRIKGQELFYYGVIEFLIGLWAVLFPMLFKFSFSLVAAGLIDNIFGDVLLAIFLTAIPAILMGTTLPYLTQGLSQSFKSSSKTHASTYAINTIGACFGTLLAGFMLIQLIGLASSLHLIGAINMGFGLLMVYIFYASNRKVMADGGALNNTVKKVPVKTDYFANVPVAKTVPILVVAACSGYLLIALESYFIRLFSIATDGSIYAYPTVVTAFIAAVGIGAALSGKLMYKSHKIYTIIPLLVMFLWLLIYLSIQYWPYADYIIKHWVVQWFDSFDYLPVVRFIFLFLIIGLPVIASSMLLPFSFHFFKNKKTSLGKTTGDLYAVATIATIFGGLLGGYWLFNQLDFQQTFLSYFIVMIIMSIVALWAFKTTIKRHVQTVAILVSFISLIFVFPASDFNKNLALSYYFQTPSNTDIAIENPSDARDWLWSWFDYDQIISSSTQAEGIVSIFDKDHTKRMITINGRSNSGTTGSDYQGNALLGLFPYLMTESPKRVLVIGLGTGVTAGAIAHQVLVESVDVCEINSAVTQQLPHFDFATFDASKNPKINVIQSDVVKYLLRSKKQYDIIVSIPSNFWTAGIENLMMPEFYTIVRSKLAKGGAFIQWIPDYDFSEQGLLTLVRSFTSAFDSSSLWRLTQEDLVLMYQKEQNGSRPWVNNRLYDNTYLNTMDSINYTNPSQLKLAQIASNHDLLDLAKRGSIHSLDRPSLGKIALNALYNPEENYSAEQAINNQ
ncbi:MAG: fused MFS/spermidine synthase [Alcanivoracaceae bacterium]|nr:fused MFS/spermidine synthase [Alcanivoracaceae bacterium]